MDFNPVMFSAGWNPERVRSAPSLDATSIALSLPRSLKQSHWRLHWWAHVGLKYPLALTVRVGTNYTQKLWLTVTRTLVGSKAACFTFPANSLLKVTRLLSHFYVHAKEIFCYSLVFRITAFQMLLRRWIIWDLFWAWYAIILSCVPNHLFLLTNYNQPSK